jgi:hypothetical protein
MKRLGLANAPEARASYNSCSESVALRSLAIHYPEEAWDIYALDSMSWFDLIKEFMQLTNPSENLLSFIAQTHFLTDLSTGRDCN